MMPGPGPPKWHLEGIPKAPFPIVIYRATKEKQGSIQLRMRHIKPYNQLFESQQGLTQEQKDWLYECTTGSWEINTQTGLVDVDGDFSCTGQGLSDFKGVRFGNIIEDFDCDNNLLTSLRGAPHVVGGSFDCSDNELTSLEGAPQSVGGAFFCSYNELTSLEGTPQKVSGDFFCSYNELTSLEGAPLEIEENFDCGNNQLTSLEGAPQSVGGSFDCSSNFLVSLEGAPQSVGYNFLCHDNPISERVMKGVIERMRGKKISLEQAVAEYWKHIPEEDRIYLAKHHPDLPPEEKREYAALARLKTRVI
jgi:hypothetical protein